MDADALRMLADLGLERRDMVSAPDEMPKGRQYRDDPREQAAIAADFEARRKHNTRDTVADGDERAARLRAWNTQTTFEADEVTGQLENRWSGQGHRAKLNQQRLNYDENVERVDARYGEERRLYLQERGFITNASTPRPARSGQDRFRDAILGGNAATPPSASSRHHRERDRAPAPPPRPRTGAHARARSPRSFGTVRFGSASQRVESDKPPAPPVFNIGAQAAAALRAAAANKQSTLQPAVDSRPASKPALQEAVTPRATPDNHAATTRPPTVGSSAASKPSTNGAQKASVVKDPTVTPKPASNAQMCRSLALWHAANPGAGCDKYHEKYPERLQYLGEARDTLIKEAIGLAYHKDESKIAEYINHHQERKWIVEAAQKAKSQVEEGHEKDIEAYCASHPRHWPFVRAAKAVFTPKRDPASAQQQESSKPSAQISPRMLPRTPSKKAQHSSSEDSVDSSGSSSDTDSSDRTAASSPPRSALGTLVAAFFDAAGKWLGNHHVGVNVPVQMTVSVTSRNKIYNPRELIDSIETLAQSMVDRSHGLEMVRLTEDGLWVEDEEL